MFVSLPKALGIFGSVLGIGGIGTVGVYATTKKTISDSLGVVRIVDKKDGNKDVWEKLKNRLKDNAPEKLTPKSQIFSSLKSKSKEDLRDVCQGIGNNIYWTIFSKDESLMEDVKNFCAITIKDSFEETLLNVEKIDGNNTDKTRYENKMNELKQNGEEGQKKPLHKSLKNVYEKIDGNNTDKTRYENKMNELKQNGEEGQKKPLHKSLKNVYEKIKGQTDPKLSWEKLAEWCSKSYKSYFFDKEDVLWKNVETYCKKTS